MKLRAGGCFSEGSRFLSTKTSLAHWRGGGSGIYGDEGLIMAMDEKVAEQAINVAALPGIVKASFVMPDGHWGYGFPIGGVAAFDPEQGGVVSAGGVGFDISCGVRTMTTGLEAGRIEAVKRRLAGGVA